MVAAVLLGRPAGIDAQGPVRPEPVLQQGHTSAVGSVAFSPDGRRILTGSRDGTALLWDAATGTQLRAFLGHKDGVAAVAFSPDGKQILTGSGDGTAVLWETDTGKRLQSFTEQTGRVGAVAFRPDGKQLLTGAGHSTAVRLWDVATGRQVRRFLAPAVVTSVAFSPDGKQVLAGTRSGRALLWDAVSGEKLQTYGDHPFDADTRVAFGPDGKQILTGYSRTATAILWETDTGKQLQTFRESVVFSVAFSPDGKYVVTGSDNGRARLWEAATGKKLHAFQRRDAAAEVLAVAFSPDGQQVVTGSNDPTASLWDTATGRSLQTYQGRLIFVRSVAFRPDGKGVLIGSGNFFRPAGSLLLWDATPGRQVRVWPQPDEVFSVAFSPDGKRFLAGFGSGAALVDTATGNLLRALKAGGNVGTVAFGPDGKQVLTGSMNGEANLWESATGKELQTFLASPEIAYDASVGMSIPAALRPDGKQVLTASVGPDPTAILWDAARGTQVRSFTGHKSWVSAVGFSPDGTQVLTGSQDGTAVLWETATGKQLQTFRGHRRRVGPVAFSPDGKKVLAGSVDATAILWDADSGKQLQRFEGHSDFVMAVAFSPDGDRVLTGSADGTARLWDVSISTKDRQAGSTEGRQAGGKEVVKLISFAGQDWLAVTPEGLFDGSLGGREKVYFRVGKGLTVLPVDRFLPDYWQPGLLAKLMAGERPLPARTFPVAGPPELRFLSPSAPVKTDQEYLTVEVEAADEGGGIDGPFLHHQNTRLHQHQSEEKAEKTIRRTFRVRLVEGKNELTIKAATSDGRIASNPVTLTVVYDKPPVKPDLWVVAAGIGKYAQKDAELLFAASDARALLRLLEGQGKPLYAKVHGTLLLDGEGTGDGLRRALQAAGGAHERDTFVLFLSGHGASVDGRYHFLPADFRNQPGQTQEDDVRKQGIPADELASLLSQIPALKKVLILDTCNAGAALKMLEKLRTSKDAPGQLKKEVERLYRAEGLYTIAAAADKEEAKEVKELGHGVLTYSLLAAFAAVDRGPLKGEGLRPAGGDVVDVDEWFKYASRRMPDVMRVYFNRDQQPVISTERSGGFPILPVPQR
jgi:WD40 repeat protein